MLSKVVARLLPFQRTTEPETKPFPKTPSVKATPGGTTSGEIPAIMGAGFVLIVYATALDVPAPGLNTVIWAVPAVRMSLAAIAAVNWVALLYVVVRSTPFQRTVVPEAKPLP